MKQRKNLNFCHFGKKLLSLHKTFCANGFYKKKISNWSKLFVKLLFLKAWRGSYTQLCEHFEILKNEYFEHFLMSSTYVDQTWKSSSFTL